MLAERYKQKRFEDGIAVGVAKGRAEVQQEWAEWNRRRESVLREGRPFDEPPPGVD